MPEYRACITTKRPKPMCGCSGFAAWYLCTACTVRATCAPSTAIGVCSASDSRFSNAFIPILLLPVWILIFSMPHAGVTARKPVTSAISRRVSCCANRSSTSSRCSDGKLETMRCRSASASAWSYPCSATSKPSGSGTAAPFRRCMSMQVLAAMRYKKARKWRWV